MSRAERRARNRGRRKLEVGRFDSPFEVVPASDLPNVEPPFGFMDLHRNEALLVFECARPGGVLLLMVQRIDGRDGLTWDQLYGVKSALGYGDREAVEIYPREVDLVNSANMRHLWLLPDGTCMAFGLDRARDPRSRRRAKAGGS